MACDNDSIPVLRGHNRWVLARTDRDAPEAEEVRETAGAFLSRALGRASPSGTRSIFEALSPPGSDASRYVIGAARPVDVRAAQPETTDEALRLAMPEGRLLGRHTDCEVTRTVAAQKPWMVVVDFDWRAPDVLVPWPRRRVNDLGFPVEADHELDWLLLAASYTGEARTRDTTLFREMSKGAKRQVQQALRGGLWVIPVAIGVVGGGMAIHYALTKKNGRAA
jgi:hypothetical protein